MLSGLLKKQIVFARLIDFVVIGLTFYMSCTLLSIDLGQSLVLHIAIYSTVVLASVRLGNRVLLNIFSSTNWVVTTILGNAAGFLIGACAMVILQLFIPEFGVAAVVVFVASFMAFFVLGTIAPLLKIDQPFSTDTKLYS